MHLFKILTIFVLTSFALSTAYLCADPSSMSAQQDADDDQDLEDDDDDVLILEDDIDDEEPQN